MSTEKMLYRGGHKLPHQSQVTGRDLHGEQILRDAGKRAMGYTLTDEQHADAVAGRSPHLPYRYRVRSAESPSLAWAAFYTEQELRTWVDAYGLTIEGDLSPGRHFTVVIPEAPVFAELVDRTFNPGDRVRIRHALVTPKWGRMGVYQSEVNKVKGYEGYVRVVFDGDPCGVLINRSFLVPAVCSVDGCGLVLYQGHDDNGTGRCPICRDAKGNE